jgi:hypothetical protein
MLPTVVHPNEILDGTIVSGFMGRHATTYAIEHHPVVRALYAQHERTLWFAGVVLTVAQAATQCEILGGEDDAHLATLAGQSIVSEVPLPQFPQIPAPPPVKELRHATIALVTDGGFVPQGDPDRIEALAATRYGAYGIEGQQQLDPGHYDNVHRGDDTTYVKQDPLATHPPVPSPGRS